MKELRLLLGVVTVVGSLALGLPAIGEPTPEAPEPVVLDLAVAPASSTLEVSAGRSLEIIVKSLAPAVRYRVIFADHEVPREPAAAFLAPAPAPPPCTELAQHIAALVQATDEASVGDHLEQINIGSSEAACRDVMNSRGRVALQFASVKSSAYLKPGESTLVKVERLSSVNREVERVWTLEAVGRTPKTAWPSADETAWLVESVARDVVEMAYYAKQRLAPSVPVSVELRKQPSGYVLAASGPAKLELGFAPEPYVWAPTAYQALVERALATFGAVGLVPAAAPDSALPERLLDARRTTLENESIRVAQRLAAEMRDPVAHEEAALVLGALTLREAPGPFADVRPLLCRMSAHLAFATSLRGGKPLSPAGRLAEALLLAQSGRGADTLTRLEALSRDARSLPGIGAWTSAIRLRATRDYRKARDWSVEPALERIEHFRAVAMALGVDEALHLLDADEVEPLPDWGRLMLVHATVEGTNRFVPVSLQAELLAGFEHAKLSPDETSGLGSALTAPADRCVSVRDGRPVVAVIGAGQWAAFIERQVLGAAQVSFSVIAGGLLLPDRAQALYQAVRPTLVGFPLLPLLERDLEIIKARADRMRQSPAGFAAEVSAASECQGVLPILSARPQLVSYKLWEELDDGCLKARDRGLFPDAGRWFSEPLLPGVAYDSNHRLKGPAFQRYKKRGVAALRRLQAAAPFEQWVGHLYAQAVEPEGPTPVQKWLELHAPLSEYDMETLGIIASWTRGRDKDGRVVLLRRMCGLKAKECLELGQALAEAKRDDEAASVYRQAFARTRDSVALSHHAGWLADYELRKGRTEAALAIAREAAETYSGSGLHTYARVLEATGRFDEAHKFYEALKDRYGDAVPLGEFAIRSFFVRGDQRFRPEASSRLHSVFPNGMQRIALAELQTPPFMGVAVRTETPEALRIGINQEDVVVALDGYRVTTYDQYRTVRALKTDPRIELIVWKRDRYVEISAELLERSFGSEFASWRIGIPFDREF